LFLKKHDLIGTNLKQPIGGKRVKGSEGVKRVNEGKEGREGGK
jgi:hypothetical protein